MSSETDVTVGSIVEDRDGTSSRGVVVNYPPIPAHDWQVHGRGTLAEDNPDYPEDDRTAVVLFENTLEEHYPEYTGYEGIPMAQINADGVPYYAFPESRLEPVGELEQPVVPLADIDPSPFHARNFSAAENRQYIASIRDRGRPDPLPTVRPVADGYEICNGHKRLWASYVAGLEEVPVTVLPLDDFRAAKYWAKHHLSGYTYREQQVALARLRDRFNETQVEQITGDWHPDTDADTTPTAFTDGGHDE
ncbi:ParB/RepB/Spo0J family partition protein [Natronolimnohabitans sp. A-GB9]|uniref:ParB/RepB/Spo0J family partition protein n=1 Tax=Natronolimnohabitans sp. A-GB9 TaxID=3069757 RepID=UPI0027B6B289|nr:ParB/RepB/Spo0J family partition protein [Natronolimnohabitans sp. A-GB9]MDQ2052945.1 ParB/RepB/Spo0J family partition protein [Natronolimnohabitans sp. A-GB9]